MNRKNVTMSLISVTILTEVMGVILNYIVISSNGGMPTMGYQTAIDHWIPINEETKFVYLADIVQVWCFALPIGDLLIVTGTVACLIVVWIAMPQARKFFPLLAASTVGIFISITIPYNTISTCLFEVAAICTTLVMYWKHRSTLKTKSTTKTPISFATEPTKFHLSG